LGNAEFVSIPKRHLKADPKDLRALKADPKDLRALKADPADLRAPAVGNVADLRNLL
jgi:hypothetical protein